MRPVRRARTLAAAPEDVWRVLADPDHLPRWWPQVQRVEEASPEAWTKVMLTDRGKTVRADYTVVDSESGRRVLWRQELEESPFEPILSESLTEIVLEPDSDGGTRVQIELRQRLRGRYRLGGFLMRRATGRQLDEALDGLDQVVPQR